METGATPVLWCGRPLSAGFNCMDSVKANFAAGGVTLTAARCYLIFALVRSCNHAMSRLLGWVTPNENP